MRAVIFILTLFVAVPVAWAEDDEVMRLDELTLIDGKKYTEVSIRKLDADSVSIIHSSGATRIPFDQLSPDDATKLGLTKEGAEKASEEKALLAAKKEVELKQAKAAKAIVSVYFKMVDGKILQVLDGGVLLTDAKVWGGRHTAFPDAIKGVWKHIADKKEIGSCVVHCETSGLVDGQYFAAIAGEIGTFTYTDTLGSSRTVQAFQSDLSAAWDAVPIYQVVPKATIISLAKTRYSLDRLIFETPLNPSK